ncbi:MAG TPA: nuclease-related domain-containing protein [Actinomycetota bacterium]|nr:nuclease-related domain-containing protein [Actinomycetota bacterium]
MHQPRPYRPDDFDDLEPDDFDDGEGFGTVVYEGTGLTVRALTAEQVDRFLDAHTGEPARLLGGGWDQRPPLPPPPVGDAPDSSGAAGAGWPAPVLADPTRTPAGGYGTPGHSALAMYRRERARELAAWSCSLPWRAALVLAAAAGAAILAGAAGLHGAALLLAGLVAGGVVGWRLRFRVSKDTRAWRDGARGERATARLLRRLARHGAAVFHDVAIPGIPANADHVVIGPGGVVLVDSKRYTGRVWQDPGGRVWHNRYPMDRPLRALRMETAAIAHLLGVAVRPVVCVHGAHVDFAGLTAADIDIVPAGRLASVLTASGQRLSRADVRALVSHAHTMLRPA